MTELGLGSQALRLYSPNPEGPFEFREKACGKETTRSQRLPLEAEITHAAFHSVLFDPSPVISNAEG